MRARRAVRAPGTVTRLLRPLVVITASGTLVLACGADDRKVDVDEGSGGRDGGGSGANGGSSDAGEPGSGGNGDPSLCTDGEGRCAGDIPERCEDGTWLPQEPCGGSKPLCSNGVCAGFRLIGHAVTMGDTPSNEEYVLLEHGFEFSEPTCGPVGGEPMCVIGGLQP